MRGAYYTFLYSFFVALNDATYPNAKGARALEPPMDLTTTAPVPTTKVKVDTTHEKAKTRQTRFQRSRDERLGCGVCCDSCACGVLAYMLSSLIGPRSEDGD